MSVSVSEPLDIIKQNLDEQIYVKLRGSREMIGKLHAYDSHCNMVLGDAIEKIFSLEENTDKLLSREEKHELVFVRGDSVILVTDATNV